MRRSLDIKEREVVAQLEEKALCFESRDTRIKGEDKKEKWREKTPKELRVRRKGLKAQKRG